MAQQECIKVPFSLPTEGSNNLTTLIQSCYGMPWLTYLLDNAIKIDSEEYIDANTFLTNVNFFFYLDPKKATYYRMKYAQ